MHVSILSSLEGRSFQLCARAQSNPYHSASATYASLHFTSRSSGQPRQKHNGRSFSRRRRRQQCALVRAPAGAARGAVQRRPGPAAVDKESRAGGQDGDGGARGGRRGGGGQHVPHRRRRGRRARRHCLPHLLLPQGHVPRVRRRRVRAQVRLDAAGERGEEGPGADRVRQLQRTRQARADRQVEPPLSDVPSPLHASFCAYMCIDPVDRSRLRLPPLVLPCFLAVAWDAGILQELIHIEKIEVL